MKKYWIILLAAVMLLGGFILGTAGVAQAEEDEIRLLYDDRKDLSTLLGVSVESVSISNEQVKSKAVGTNTPDAHVLQYENGILYATGTGTATLTVNGVDYSVTVEAAPISLFLITGHSVGIGEQGNAAQSVAIEAGQAYSSHRYWTFENVDSDEKDLVIVPSEVTETTGLGSKAENRLSGIDAFAVGGGGTIGEGSGLAWKWNQLTGEKVWVINAARGGSCLNHWIPDAEGPVPGTSNRFYGYFKYLYNSARDAYQNAQAILKNEIAAGHYTLSHMAMFYHNGANFSNFSGWNYVKLEEYYNLMWSSFKADLSTDMDGDGKEETLESMGLIPHWFSSSALSYATDKSASFYMGFSDAYPDVYVATDYTWYYRTDEDLANFPKPTYTTQSEPVSVPDSLLSTKNGGSSDNSFFCYNDVGHLSQVTYNLQGIHVAEGLYAHLFETPQQVTGQFYDYNANPLPDTMTMAAGESVFAVPRVMPVWYNDLTITVSGNIRLNYPGTVVAEKAGTGTLTLSNGDQVLQTVTFNITDGHIHCSCVNADALPENHECNEHQVWTPMVPGTGNAVKLTEDGYYVLNWTGSKAASIQVADGVNAHICLNGATIYAKQTVQLGNKSSLTICDCSLGQQGMITVSGGATGAPVWMNGTKTVTLMSGKITGSENNRNFPAVASTSSYSNFYMYGGTLIGGVAEMNYDDTTASDTNKVENYGGAVQMVRGAFTMYGGTISGGESTTHGGTVGLANTATFTMYGGTITGGKSTTYGGAIGLAGTSAFTMYGGTIEGGESTTYGGTVGSGATGTGFTMYGGTIQGGTSTTHGAAIGCGNGTVTIYDGTIYGGTAKTYGGTASVMNSTKFYIYGGTFSNGSANSHSAGIYTNKSGIILGGDPTIEEIYLKGTTAKLSISTEIPLTTAKSIGIAMETPGVFTNESADCAVAFVSNAAGYGVGYTGSALKLTTHVAQVGTSTYTTFAEAIAAGNTVRLLQDVNENVTVTDPLYLDLNGCDLSGLTVGGQLYVTDSANMYYAADSCGSLACTLGENGVINDGKTVYKDGQINYVKIETDGAYSFHRVDAVITHISLQPRNEALGYKAKLYGDGQVLEIVDAFGMNLYITEDCVKTYTKAPGEDGLFTLRLQNIMKCNGGEIPVYGAPVIVIGDEIITGQVTNTTMKDTVLAVNEMEGLSQEQKAAVYSLYSENQAILDLWLGDSNKVKDWIF